jgi:hypothetical protein
MGDVSLQIMPPLGTPDWNQNDNSIGIVVEYGLLDELVAELADCVDIELPKQPIALALAVTKETAFDDVPDLAWLTLASARTRLDKCPGLTRAPPPCHSHGSNRPSAAVPESWDGSGSPAVSRRSSTG